MNYTLVASCDVTFAFNKSSLGKTDEAMIDDLIQKVQSTPRAVFELVGFTDRTGTAEYNLALSRRRAESVERYLVQHGVAPRGIHIVGLGKEQVSSELAVTTGLKASDSGRLARRVVVRLYAPGANIESASLR
jgi:outer membrane protein OmpA-like peptidoglycan-associated protein